MKVWNKLKSEVSGVLARAFWRSTGWKWPATVNCILLSVVSVFLIGLLIAVAVQARSISDPILIYEGSCRGHGVSYVNLFLHLLINILSTLVVSYGGRVDLDL